MTKPSQQEVEQIVDLHVAASHVAAESRQVQKLEAELAQRRAADASKLLSDVPHFVLTPGGTLEAIGAWPNRTDVLYRGSDLFEALIAPVSTK